MTVIMMNKIKVMPGQVWECTKAIIGLPTGDSIKIINEENIEGVEFEFNGHSFMFPSCNSIYDNFKFVPQTDKIMGMEPEKMNEEKPEMNEIPVSWLKEKGIKLAIGDKLTGHGYSPYTKQNYTINPAYKLTKSDITGINKQEDGVDHIFITSFADRENTGKQPVADWVPVYCSWNDGVSISSGAAHWVLEPNAMYGKESWKPNIEELYKIYLSEQDKPKVEKECLCELTKNGSVKLKGPCTIKVCDGCKESKFEDPTVDFIVTGGAYCIDVDEEIPVPAKGYYEEEVNKIAVFVQENKLVLTGETPVNCVIRELAEKHGIDIRTDEQKEASKTINKLKKLISAIELGLDCRKIAEFLHQNNFKG